MRCFNKLEIEFINFNSYIIFFLVPTVSSDILVVLSDSLVALYRLHAYSIMLSIDFGLFCYF